MAIETERLILRDWREADVAPFIRHTNTPVVMRWLGGVQAEADLEASLRTRMMRWQVERGFTFWAVERRADGALLGFCGLKLADTAGTSIEGVHEVGWRLREDAWGQGYAKEAAIASIDFAFDALGAERVVLSHIEEIDGLSHDDLLRFAERLRAEGRPVTFAHDGLVVEV